MVKETSLNDDTYLKVLPLLMEHDGNLTPCSDPFVPVVVSFIGFKCVLFLALVFFPLLFIENSSIHELCLPRAQLLKFRCLTSVPVSSSPPSLFESFFFSTGVSLTKYIPMSTTVIFSSITKPDSMSNQIKEGYLT